MVGPVPVHKLADAFSISRPAISRHLRVLKTAGLVVEVKKGRENLYTFKAGKLAGALKWLNAIALPGYEVAPAEGDAAPTTVSSVPEPAPETRAEEIPTSRGSTSKKLQLTEIPDATAIEAPLFAPKTDKAPRATKAAAVSQMGFDF